MSQKRMRIWRHNGLLGSISMAEHICNNIDHMDSTSDEAKQLSYEIAVRLNKLYDEIQNNRIDPPEEV